MEDNKILVLIHQKLTGEISPETDRQVNDWLDEHQENRDFFDEIEKSWELSLHIGEAYQPNVQAGLARLKKRIAEDKKLQPNPPKSKIKPLILFFRVAAVLIIAAGIGFLLNPYLNNQKIAGPFKTGENESLVVHLKDGSMIWMHENSELTLQRAYNRSKRNISFSGTGLFDIASDPVRPFHIDGGQTDVDVLGTRFIYNSGDTETAGSVEVMKGKVKFSIHDTDQSVILTANEAGQLANETTLSKAMISEKPFAKSSNKLIFRDVPLNKAIKVIEQQYEIQLNWSDQDRSLNCILISDYDNARLNDIFETLELSFGIDIQKTGETSYTLVGGKCPE